MPLKVYYLDDEPSLCEIFLEYFSSADVEITTFVDGPSAIAACQRQAPDLFFIDYRLGDTTGDKVACSLPASVPKYLITGEINLTPEFKFAGILPKPYEIETLQALIHAALKT